MDCEPSSVKKSAELGDEREVKLKGISGSESVFYNTVSGWHVWLKLQNLVFVLVTVSSIFGTQKRDAVLGIFGDMRQLGTCTQLMEYRIFGVKLMEYGML